MYKKRILLTNFSRGMVSERMSGRVNTELSRSAVQDINGFIVHPDGGLVRRRGTMYVKDGLGVSPGEGIPGFIVYRKRNTTDGYETAHVAYAYDDSGTYRMVLKNLGTGVEDVLSNSKFEDLVGTGIRTSGKMNNVYSLKTASLSLKENTATLSEKTDSYNPTEYSRVYSLPNDFYLDYYLESGDGYMLFESKNTRYLATDDTSPTLNYADIQKDTQSADLSTVTAPYPTEHSYVYELPGDCEHIFYIDTENTDYDIDETVRSIYTDTDNPVLHYTDIEELYGFDYIYSIPDDFYSADSIEPDLEYLVYAPDAETYLYTNATPSGITLHYHADISGSFNEYLHVWNDVRSFLIDLSTNSLDGGDEKTDQEISTVYQNRLIAFDRDMGKLWMSAPYAYLDFTGSSHLNLEPDFYGLEKPQWVMGRSSVFAGTDQGEYEIASSLPYFSNETGGLIMRKISSIGSEMAEYFGPHIVLVKDRRIIQIAYQGQGQYQSTSVAEYIDNKRIKTLVTVEFGTHRYLCFVDSDNKLYVYTSAESSGVGAWTVLAENVAWIHTFGQDLYVAIERDGGYSLEIVPFDNIEHPGGRDSRLSEEFFNVNVHGDRGGFVYCWDDLSGEHIIQDPLPPSSTVSVFEVPGNEYIGDYETDSDGYLVKSATEILTDTGHDGEGESVSLYAFEKGQYYTSSMKTLPIYVPVEEGLSWEQPRRINKVILKVIKSMAAKVRINEGIWESWSSDTEYSGSVEFWTDGTYDSDVQVEVKAVEEKPLHIISIEAEVSVGE